MSPRIKKPQNFDTEAGLHRFTHQLLKLTGFANIQFLHIPNGLQRAPRVAAMLKGMGAKNGAADFLVIVKGKANWLELKNGKKGKLSPDQINFRDEALRAGANYIVASNPMEVRTALYLWGAINVLHDTVSDPVAGAA